MIGALLFASAFALWRIGRRLRFFLHLLQLEGYKPMPALRWTLARPLDVLARPSHFAGAVILFLLVVGVMSPVATLLLWGLAFISSRRYRRDRPKKPLVATPRLKRLALASGAFPLVLLVGAAAAEGTVAAYLGALLLADLLAPLWTVLAAWALLPVERAIQNGFKRAARRRLASRPDLTVVAVTGSYGKTSVKFAIAEVLGRRYQVLATPGSFNTPMGICKVINQQLRDHHQILVLEMGIRHPGDIAELCAIARPDIAVITGIGVAHLESMGSIDAIAREKGSLFTFLRKEGIAVLDADDAFAETLMGRAPGAVLRTSASGSDGADLAAKEVRFGPHGTAFSVVDGEGRSSELTMALLGRHNVSNALLALAVGKALDVRVRQGARGLASLKPIPHRLALREEAGLFVLDDAFNSNPVGARNALEVLGQFPGRRFVITPGMVELGPMEAEENERFGRLMADGADEVILVGPARTRPIAKGLLGAGFATERMHVVNTLFEAREVLATRASSGDVVLYENDLPDQYTEA